MSYPSSGLTAANVQVLLRALPQGLRRAHGVRESLPTGPRSTAAAPVRPLASARARFHLPRLARPHGVGTRTRPNCVRAVPPRAAPLRQHHAPITSTCSYTSNRGTPSTPAAAIASPSVGFALNAWASASAFHPDTISTSFGSSAARFTRANRARRRSVDRCRTPFSTCRSHVPCA